MDRSQRKDPSRPLWLDAIRRFERLIGVPVEQLVRSDAYFETLPKLRRLQTQMVELVAAYTDDWFRLFNVPAASDVRRMREQLSRMERQLEKLTKELADQEERADQENGRKPAARKRGATT